ncbi:craniofacial development protein 1-like [Telopea speciosissima]|uniref:craniofacial development protein 1-like n=1 Tax=Telopea speciosissima TaxID=54955 RepID=UPI001CC4187A|nr:craniofacial development protein 1-like [Telopea speciosissima]
MASMEESSSWMIEQAKEELQILEAQHPNRFEFLKMELRNFIYGETDISSSPYFHNSVLLYEKDFTSTPNSSATTQGTLAASTAQRALFHGFRQGLAMDHDAGNVGGKDEASVASVREVSEVAAVPNPQAQLDENERKARVNAVWEQLNKGVSIKNLQLFTKQPASTIKNMEQKSSHSWMTALGPIPKMTGSPGQDSPQKRPTVSQNCTSEEAKKLAAAANAAMDRGKIEIKEVRDFAGQEIEVKKFIDADSKEAAEKAEASAGPVSAVDAVLEQIKKKPKLTVLDKTKKDWGEFKEENKGLEEELDAYKKSSNQYLASNFWF